MTVNNNWRVNGCRQKRCIAWVPCNSIAFLLVNLCVCGCLTWWHCIDVNQWCCITSNLGYYCDGYKLNSAWHPLWMWVMSGLTLWTSHCSHMGTAIKHPVPDQVKQLKPSFVIFHIWAIWRSWLSVRVPGCQKITNDGLTQSDTGCFIPVPTWQQWASKVTLGSKDAYILPWTKEALCVYSYQCVWYRDRPTDGKVLCCIRHDENIPRYKWPRDHGRTGEIGLPRPPVCTSSVISEWHRYSTGS